MLLVRFTAAALLLPLTSSAAHPRDIDQDNVAIFKASKEAAERKRPFAAAPASLPAQQAFRPAVLRTIDPVFTDRFSIPNGITLYPHSHLQRCAQLFDRLNLSQGYSRRGQVVKLGREYPSVSSRSPLPRVLLPRHVLKTFRPKKTRYPKIPSICSCHGRDGNAGVVFVRLMEVSSDRQRQ